MVLRSDGIPTSDARKRYYRDSIVKQGIPVFDEMADAAAAIAAVATVARFRASRGL